MEFNITAVPLRVSVILPPPSGTRFAKLPREGLKLSRFSNTTFTWLWLMTEYARSFAPAGFPPSNIRAQEL